MVHALNPLNFPLYGTRLIEASAGTGKTYTIAALYLRLVLGHGGDKNGFFRPLTPPEILVVTYTNAATDELRERIRSRLAQAAACFRGGGSGDPLLDALRDEYDPQLHPQMALRLDRAAQWMDEAAIYTIHAWCQRMLRQHAFDSLSLFDLELVPSDDDLLETAACDYWRARFYPLSPDILAEFKETAGISTPQALLSQVRALINDEANEDEADDDPGHGEHGAKDTAPDPFRMMAKRQAAVDRARRIWQPVFQTAVDAVEDARAAKILNNNKYRKNSLAAWTHAMDLWVNQGGPLPDTKVLVKFSAQGLTAGASKGKVPPSHAAYDALDQLMAELDGMDIRTALIHHAAADIRRRVADQKAQSSRMGFNDLLTRMDQALCANPELARIIREQFPVAMIDEFQDTDLLQYRTFSTIYLEQPDTGWFMIGDPKQAIYAFRGADIYTYLRARNDAQENQYTLETNYRSTLGMVAAVNRLFSHGASFKDGAFLFKDEIPFEAVTGRGRDEELMVDDQPQVPMTLWQLDQTSPVNKTGPDGYMARMAEAAAFEIARLITLGAATPCRAGFRQLDGHLTPLKPGDIAVLVRDGKEAESVCRAMEKRGVRSVYLSDRESVFNSTEALSMLYLLRACAHPTDDRLLRAALAVPLLNLSMADLDRLNRDEAVWESELVRFKTLGQIWRTRGVLPMVRALLAGFDVGTCFQGGERQMTNVLHLAELLQTAAASLDGEQGLIRWLAGCIETPPSGVDDQMIRLESDEALVQVVTIHKSKGLEYPLVFLPFICNFRKTTRNNTTVARYHDKDGRLVKRIHPDDSELERVEHERLAEDLRMLYVALTRSRHACWLGMGVLGQLSKKGGETSLLNQSAVGYLLAGGEPIKTTELAGVLANVQGDCPYMQVVGMPDRSMNLTVNPTGENVLGTARAFTGKIRRDWRLTSYSGILTGAALAHHGAVSKAFRTTTQGASDTASEDQLRETMDEASPAMAVASGALSIFTFPKGPAPGTFLHDILEWAANEGFARVAQNREMVLDEITRRCDRQGWGAWAEVLTAWFMDLIGFDMGDKVPLCLSDLTPAQCIAEMEFMFPAHGVDIRELDRLVNRAVLPGMERPLLRADRVNGMLKGFIDLVFSYQGQYFVLDYKSNHLGNTPADYDPQALASAMTHHRYDLQYLIYTLALHRLLLARRADYDYDRDVGGAVYLFLRGAGPKGWSVYAHKPPRDVIEAMDDLFRHTTKMDACND